MKLFMKKCTCSHRRHVHVNLASRKAKKSILKRIKANLAITNTQKFSNGEEEAIKKFNLSRCQHKKKKKKNQICKGKSHQMEIHQVPTIHFQDEIMMDILRRLPMRSILRFKCVSKFWKSLIDDPYFKRTHYIHNRDNQNSKKILIAESLLTNDDTFSFYTSSLSMVEDKQKLDWPTSCIPMDARIFCSCDGLVLIRVCSEMFDEELLLWNPSTRESILLPHPEYRIMNYVFGLEYDATSEGYKILAVNLNGKKSINISIEFLSIKRNSSWRRIDYPTDIQRVRGFRDCGTDNLAFLHGAFHWLGKSPSGYYTTVSLNISNEVFGEVPLLKQMYDLCRLYFFFDHGVSVLRGMLCFYSTYNNLKRSTNGIFKLWVMKDYGVMESWTNFIKIQDTDLFLSARPVYMFADCQVLLHFQRFAYFSSNFTTSGRPFDLCPECDTIKRGIVYAESFISPTSLLT
ncbi:F-box/kelch-repeat protein At3g23880-like isoform X1 [Solanum lycopersicum]|uniref:F-box/kelch-repeat protein At3g23880-like isoform X1 n=1 Tax=Solanum lycopersicum TaxID=4081 RepID=UPI003747E005